jgi:hypothetical protein
VEKIMVTMLDQLLTEQIGRKESRGGQASRLLYALRLANLRRFVAPLLAHR